MAVVKGTNAGFVVSAPVTDPAGSNTLMDTHADAVKDTSPVGATGITEIGWWCDGATEEANFEIGLYDHDAGNDKPGNQLYSDTVNAKGTGAGWKTVAVNWAISAETIYWIAVQLDNTSTTTNTNRNSTGADRRSIVTSASDLEDPWPAGSTDTTWYEAFYAVWSSATVYAEGTKTVTGALAGSLSTALIVRVEGTKTVTAAVTVSLASENYVNQSGFPPDRPSDYDGDEYWDEDAGTWGSTRTTIPGNWAQNVLAISEEGEIYFRTV